MRGRSTTAVDSAASTELSRWVRRTCGELIREYMSHYHIERPHQGLDGAFIQPSNNRAADSPLVRRQRLGGLLLYGCSSAQSASHCLKLTIPARRLAWAEFLRQVFAPTCSALNAADSIGAPGPSGVTFTSRHRMAWTWVAQRELPAVMEEVLGGEYAKKRP